jgi:Mg-chelatase subunit ChlD
LPALAPERRSGGIRDRNLPAGVTVDPDSVQVRLDGTVLDASSPEPIETNEQIDRSVLIALDTSESMNSAIEEAKAAAETFSTPFRRRQGRAGVRWKPRSRSSRPSIETG